MIANANSIAQHVIQIKNRIAKHANVIVKLIVYSWNPFTCICENGKHLNLKSIVDTSVIVFDETINATDDSVSKNVTNAIPTNMTNTISTNVTSAVPINSDDKKVRNKMASYV